MNEKALQYAYELFQADGYADSLEDFKNLINTNSDAFNYSFELFQAGLSMYPEGDNWSIVKVLEKMANTKVEW